MTTWKPAPVLIVARDDVNRTWPGRDHASDGIIGDAAHAAGTSDHNPDSRGVVHAEDFDTGGIAPMVLVAALIRHPSTNYVIHNRTIYSRIRDMAPHVYTGSDPHTGHIHWSILYTTAAENSGQHLILDGTTATTTVATGSMTPMPVLRLGSTHQAVHTLQAVLRTQGWNLANDGIFGQQTLGAVRNFQAQHHLGVDGIVGPRTWAALAQAILTYWGFSTQGIDGIIGPNTVSAIREAQKAKGLLSVDGIFGPLTWKALT